MKSGLFKTDLEVVNIGLEMFRNDLVKQGTKVNQVKFLPPADGDEEVLKALDYLDSDPIRRKIEAANKEAVERIINSRPVLVGYDKAINVIPGMKKYDYPCRPSYCMGKHVRSHEGSGNRRHCF